MGLYINKGNEEFRRARKGEYVDKSGLIAVVNDTLFSERSFSCVTRSRRFGKSMAAKMLYAYYDQSCDSRSLFADLEIARDPSFEEHLNKYPTIFIDITDFTSRDIPMSEVVPTLEREVKADVRTVYPEAEVEPDDDLMAVLTKTALHYSIQFVAIIDEWDVILREAAQRPEACQGEGNPVERYVKLLRRLFKGRNTQRVFAAVYMTGILPIKRYKTESAMNNFTEYSMVDPGDMGRFFGFTKDEVQTLAKNHGMNYDELEKWYDGYKIGDEQSMFNPNSVMEAVRRRRCRSFWSATGSFDAVAGYINRNFDGLKDGIIEMLAGGREKVDPTRFQNDMSIVLNRDDVYTVLIHLGYLSYEWQRSECYIPNREVGGEMVNAVKENKWEEVVKALEQSEKLLEATLRGDGDYVAFFNDEATTENTSIFKYNDENSLSCVISIAYYYARNDFQMIRELPTGKGYADIVFLPRKNVSKPALVIELKNNKTAKAAIDQIKERNYPQQIEKYTGDMLLVGINYGEATKKHECRIESWRKD